MIDNVDTMAGIGGHIVVKPNFKTIASSYKIDVSEWRIYRHLINSRILCSGSAGYIRRERVALDWEWEITIPWNYNKPADAILEHFQDLERQAPGPPGLYFNLFLGKIEIFGRTEALPPPQYVYQGYGIGREIVIVCSSNGDDIIRLVARGEGTGPLRLRDYNTTAAPVWVAENTLFGDNNGVPFPVPFDRN